MGERSVPILIDERDLTIEHCDAPVYRVAVMTRYNPRYDSWDDHAWWEFPNTPLPVVIEWAYSVEERPSKVEIWLIRPEDSMTALDEDSKEGFLLHTAILE